MSVRLGFALHLYSSTRYSVPDDALDISLSRITLDNARRIE